MNLFLNGYQLIAHVIRGSAGSSIAATSRSVPHSCSLLVPVDLGPVLFNEWIHRAAPTLNLPGAVDSLFCPKPDGRFFRHDSLHVLLMVEVGWTVIDLSSLLPLVPPSVQVDDARNFAERVKCGQRKSAGAILIVTHEPTACDTHASRIARSSSTASCAVGRFVGSESRSRRNRRRSLSGGT